MNVSVSLELANDKCKGVTIVLGAVAPTIVRAKKAEEILLKANSLDKKAIEEAAQTAAKEVTPITDLRSTAEYRQEMVKVLVKQALEKSWARAK
ncbi:Carbon monoxide dehydrogenase medium chain [bioreactor metagenome]|uniref:Carbon monoxide dehydrogenase medium chain n=1 Tax=bioreactor metagenome TaxID=1076179 RepID=A0A645J8F4_9ZZZZ